MTGIEFGGKAMYTKKGIRKPKTVEAEVAEVVDETEKEISDVTEEVEKEIKKVTEDTEEVAGNIEESEDKGQDITEEEAEEIKKAAEEPKEEPVADKKVKPRCKYCNSLDVEEGFQIREQFVSLESDRGKAEGVKRWFCNACRRISD